MFAQEIEGILRELNLIEEYSWIREDDYWGPEPPVRSGDIVLEGSMGVVSKKVYTLLRRLQQEYNDLLERIFLREDLDEKKKFALFQEEDGCGIAYKFARLYKVLYDFLFSQFGRPGTGVEIRKDFRIVLVPKRE